MDLCSLMLAKFEEIRSTTSSITNSIDYPAITSPFNNVSMPCVMGNVSRLWNRIAHKSRSVWYTTFIRADNKSQFGKNIANST